RDMQVLHDVGTRLVAIDDPRLLYDAILAAAIELTHADAGTLQTFDAAADELVLGAARGFDDVMTAHFRRVRAERGTACGAALCNPARTFYAFDDGACEGDESIRMQRAGFASAQSTPLVARGDGRPVGMISTYWRRDQRPEARALRYLDLLARQAADTIEHR